MPSWTSHEPGWKMTHGENSWFIPPGVHDDTKTTHYVIWLPVIFQFKKVITSVGSDARALNKQQIQ